MAQRTFEEKDAAYKAKEKAEIAAHHKAHGEAMGALRQETVASGRAHAAATSAYSKPLALL